MKSYAFADFKVIDLLRRGAYVIVPFLIIFLAGLWLVFIGTAILVKAFASNKWPVAEGRIIDLEAKKERQRGRRKSVSWAYVTYKYQVMDKSYVGDTVSFAHSESDEYLTFANRKIGQSIRVWYNPDNPQEATLMTGGVIGGLFPLFFGGVLSIVGAGASLGMVSFFRRTGYFLNPFRARALKIERRLIFPKKRRRRHR